MPEDKKILTTEYHCDCGRQYIIPQDTQGALRKCSKCGRTMYPVQDIAEIFVQKERKKNPYAKHGKLEDTIEYQYQFNPDGQRMVVKSEPFSIKSLFRKLISLFSNSN